MTNQQRLEAALSIPKKVRIGILNECPGIFLGELPRRSKCSKSETYIVDEIEFWRARFSFACYVTPEATAYLMRRGFSFNVSDDLMNVYKSVALIEGIR